MADEPEPEPEPETLASIRQRMQTIGTGLSPEILKDAIEQVNSINEKGGTFTSRDILRQSGGEWADPAQRMARPDSIRVISVYNYSASAPI